MILDNSTSTPLQTPTAFPVTLPFQFPFDVSTFGSMTVWSTGALSFDTGSQAIDEDNCGGFPYSNSSCPPPTTVIAPWWGDLTVCYNGASVAYLVAGATGSRTLTVQWNGLNTDDFCEAFSGTSFDSFYSFQAVLHEASGNIDFIYGPSTPGTFPFCEGTPTETCIFAGGIEDGPGGSPDLSCNAQCSTTDFPSEGVEFTFSQHPDVQITQVQTPGSGVQGGTMLVTVKLYNSGGLPGNGGTGSLYFSTDGQTFDASNPLTTFGPFNIGASAAAPISRQVSLPATAPLGTGWIIATITVPGDDDPTGKQVASAAFDIFGAEPDFDAAGLTAPSSGNAGSAISVAVTIKNDGSAPASKIPYDYYLSSSPTVSPSDLQIGSGTISSLAAGATYTNTDQVQLPASLPAGSYTVGVIVNPDMTITEYTYSNDSAVATPPMQVAAGTLSVSTTSVPAASVGAPYQTVLVASGGGGAYSWAIGTGTLPAGIELAPDGTVSGTPSTAGDNPVTVKVSDQSGHSATAPLDFKVDPQALPLAVLTNSLPGGSFGVNYSVPLVAIGGSPPYQWSIVAGAGSPPPGIGISTDGTLAGAPEADGAYVFQVQVQDSANATAQSPPLDLQVLSPGSVGVAEAQLPPATEGVNYSGELLAAGGTPPYSWSLLDDLQLPSGPGEQSQDLATAMPAGLSLDPSGNLSGLATVTGAFALTVQVTDSSTPAVTGSDTVLLNVLPGTALSILNPTVPDATVGKPYIDTLDTNATNANVTFEVVDGLGNDSDAARQSLPPGLVLDPSGVLEGTPAASATGTSSTTYNFLVKADDGTGRLAVVAIALTVEPAPASGGGCASGGGESPLVISLVLACLALRRKRNS